MHWALETAKELIDKNPGEDLFVCASGISPSGSVHIGNFREMVTTFFVVKALQKLGKDTKFIFSWDDFDRFRKVPKNVDSSFEKYLGMPYADVPDPYGCCASYAAHFQNEFEGAVAEFGMDVEYIYQNKEYRSGRYNPYIIQALNARKKIYDILMDYKSQDATAEEREKFYPVSIYCTSCNKDSTTVTHYSEADQRLQYECGCGHVETVDVNQANNMKLLWKIDWPMRWLVEGVLFEPGGRDHSSEHGSYVVSSRISKEIFNYQPPAYVAYDFIGIKGSNGKMSSSSGNTITPAEVLNVYLPEITLYVFSKYHPSAGFNFGFDEDVIRNYTEFERYYAKSIKNELDNEVMEFTMELADLHRDLTNYPKFGMLAGLLPLIDFNVDVVRDVLDASIDEAGLVEVCKKIKYWTKNWRPDEAIRVRDEKNVELFHSLSAEDQAAVRMFAAVVSESENLTSDELMNKIYAICFDEDVKEKKRKQKELFKLVYTLLTDRQQGPRISLLVKAIGVKKTLELVMFD